MSRLLTCDPANPDMSVVDAAAVALTNDLTVVMPTETQYGLLLRADRDNSLARLNSIKRREEAHKPALFVSDMTMAERFCEVDPTARALADRFLPGPLTLVLPGRRGQEFVAGDFLSADGFGIRISSSPLVAAVMARVPFAVTATSANISGELTLPSVNEIMASLGENVDLYIDGGLCRRVVPSTVVKIDGGLAILRHGAIPEKEIRAYLETAGAA